MEAEVRAGAVVKADMADIKQQMHNRHKPQQVNETPLQKQFYRRFHLPLWLANLILFSLMILVVLIYFLIQTERERRIFYRHSQEHSELLAKVIQLNADNAMAAGEVVKKVAHTFMLNSARFIDYLDAIEPFSATELSALAQESGLRGITIYHNQQKVSGPELWEDEEKDMEPIINGKALFSHNPKQHIFTLIFPRTESQGTIRLGLDARQLEALQNQVGLRQLLITLNNISGISYVHLIPNPKPSEPAALTPQITNSKNSTIEVRLPMPDHKLLCTGFKSDSLVAREKDLWRDFILFALFIGALGCFFSWLLYRYQLSILTQAQRSQQRLAREREDAILGRAAAAVAHEIRNPLNAIDIGLQRLELEESGLSKEYISLTAAMRNAVGRANSIVGDLRRFAQPLTPKLQDIAIILMLEDIIALYQARADAAQIKITLSNKLQPPRQKIRLDPILLGQALENICKNAIEAQAEGGFIEISLQSLNNDCQITFANAGFKLAPEDVNKITEPWFTTKTRGTGLGLALVERIINAHNGRFQVACREPEVLLQHIFLPCN